MHTQIRAMETQERLPLAAFSYISFFPSMQVEPEALL